MSSKPKPPKGAKLRTRRTSTPGLELFQGCLKEILRLRPARRQILLPDTRVGVEVGEDIPGSRHVFRREKTAGAAQGQLGTNLGLDGLRHIFALGRLDNRGADCAVYGTLAV